MERQFHLAVRPWMTSAIALKGLESECSSEAALISVCVCERVCVCGSLLGHRPSSPILGLSTPRVDGEYLTTDQHVGGDENEEAAHLRCLLIAFLCSATLNCLLYPLSTPFLLLFFRFCWDRGLFCGGTRSLSSLSV